MPDNPDVQRLTYVGHPLLYDHPVPYKLTSPPYYAKSRLEGLTRMLAMLEQEVELLKQDIARESTEPIIPENQS